MNTKLQTKNYSYWSTNEIAHLREFYSIIHAKNLAKMFPKRTTGSIVAKALSLELPSAKLWQQKENNILYKFFSEIPQEKLLNLLPTRTWSGILAQGERMGLLRRRNKPRLAINECYFKKWSPNMAYILGFISSDGCIVKGTHKGYSDSLKFGVQQKDIDILKKIKKEFSSKHKISLVKNASHISIASQKIVDDLKILGISYRKSLRENVPKIPKKYIRDFIRGLIDGDGSICFDKREYPTLSLCGGEKIVTFVKNHFFSEFNIHSKISQAKKNGKKYNLFYITYRANSAKTLIEYLYDHADLYLERKFRLYKRCLHTKMKNRKNYTEKEIELLRQHYSSSAKNKILAILPCRSWNSVQNKTHKLKLYKYNIKKIYS
ncbi:MAG: hypothetical protein ABH967_02310 [Patescibacteria group bacterium]